VNEDARLTIALTSTQVSQVLRHASRRPGLAHMFSALDDPKALRDAVAPLLNDDAYSRSTLRALLVLGSFDADGSERELTDVARALRLSPSTTHRYVGTWLALGLLEQDPVSRRYRRAVSASAQASP
jgi:IclR-like helix-turn-helix domain-containing protein